MAHVADGKKQYDLNTVALIGRMAAPADLRYTAAGKAVANFSLAVGRGEECDFIDCTAFDKTAELVNEWGEKGRQVAVTGKIQARVFETQEGAKRKVTSVACNTVQFLAKAAGDGGGQRPQGGQQRPPQQGQGGRPQGGQGQRPPGGQGDQQRPPQQRQQQRPPQDPLPDDGGGWGDPPF